MRLRTFTARSMPDAMALVRQHLGPEAIILSTQDVAGAISVTAALDGSPPEVEREAAAGTPAWRDPIDSVEEALLAHGTPPQLVETVLAAAAAVAGEDPVAALAGGFAAVFAFAPLGERPAGRPLMLVGPPGAGKTVTIAKLATRALRAGRRPWVITCDMVRAGGVAQLESLMRVLDLPLLSAEDPDELAAILAAARGEGEAPVLIDSAGINPYRAEDRDDLAGFIAVGAAEPVLVLPGGGDIVDQIETAHAFRELGCARLVPTRLDMVQRLGSLLAAADETRLAFAEAGTAPAVADGLAPMNALALARFLLPDAMAGDEHCIPERIGS